MKTKIILVLAIAIILLESCSRSCTPYQAANSSSGKRCGKIR